MPRASTVKTEEEAVVPKKRAIRKRAVSEDDTAQKPRMRKPRATAATVGTPTEQLAETGTESSRRAPTGLGSERIAAKRSTRTLVVALILMIVITGVGSLIGMSDGGQIDVIAVVNARNEKIQRGEVREGESTMTVPVQNNDIRPNGGLVPADPSQIPVPVTEVATTTATTTDETATSTSDTAEPTALSGEESTEASQSPATEETTNQEETPTEV